MGACVQKRAYHSRRSQSLYMKSTLIFLIVALPYLAFAGSSTPEELARSYVAAVQAQDAAAIKKLVHPKFLEGLNPEGVKLIDWWIKHSIADASKLQDPMWIRSKNISSSLLTSMSVEWTWNVPPEIQIEMQPYRELGNSQENTGFMSVQFAAKYQGQLYFVFQMPKKP